jgi:hypothetical protein
LTYLKLSFLLSYFTLAMILPVIKILLDKTKLNSVALDRKRTIPTERPPLFGEVSVNLADRGCRVFIATDPHSR